MKDGFGVGDFSLGFGLFVFKAVSSFLKLFSLEGPKGGVSFSALRQRCSFNCVRFLYAVCFLSSHVYFSSFLFPCFAPRLAFHSFPPRFVQYIVPITIEHRTSTFFSYFNLKSSRARIWNENFKLQCNEIENLTRAIVYS